MSEPILCYIEGNFAYFTTQTLKDQWGDDWDDAPYEHNAGEPYKYTEHDAKQGKVPWEIVKVAFEGDFNQPSFYYDNSPYSVSSINSGESPWLATTAWADKMVVIKAGVPLNEFINLVKSAGGKVYKEV